MVDPAREAVELVRDGIAPTVEAPPMSANAMTLSSDPIVAIRRTPSEFGVPLRRPAPLGEGPQRPAPQPHGVDRLREVLKKSEYVSLNALCDEAAERLDQLHARLAAIDPAPTRPKGNIFNA